MSEKTKELKKKAQKRKPKQTGFDYMYRGVTAVLAIAVFPITYFMNLIYYALDWTNIVKIQNAAGDLLTTNLDLQGIIKLLAQAFSSSNDANQEISVAEDYISLAKWSEFKDLLGMAAPDGGFDIKSLIFNNAELRPLVISLAIFIAALVVALVIFIISIFANKPKVIAALSGAGTILCMISNFVFMHFFSAPLVSGEKTLVGILGIAEGTESEILLNAVGKVYQINYSEGFFTVMFILLGIFIWSLSVLIVNAGEPAERAKRAANKAKKKAKKAKKEEKKAHKAMEEAEKIYKEEKKAEKEQKKIEEAEKKQAKAEKKEAEAEKKSAE